PPRILAADTSSLSRATNGGLTHELAGARRFHGRRERRDVVGAVVAERVDEEGWRAGDAREIRRVDVLCDPAGARTRSQIVLESLDVEPEVPGVADEIAVTERVLALEQEVVHLPERTLLCRRFRCLGRPLRVRMDVVQRQVPPRVVDIAVLAQELAHHWL